MLSFSNLLYAPTYKILGVAAVLTVGVAVYNDARVIDMTEGVGIGGPVDVDTATPAATIQASWLATKGIALTSLRNSTLLLDGVTWRVVSYQPKQSPSGAADGEVWLFLEGTVE